MPAGPGRELRATFVRSESERDRVHVVRSDGSEVSWSFPSYGDGLPHDLVHLVVEAGFGLRSGFWGRVDGGADPGRINAEANRRGGKGKYAGFGPEQRDLALAEALAGAPWGVESADEDLAAAVGLQCRELGAPVPEPSRQRIVEVRSALRGLAQRWKGLRPKGALTVSFRADSPEEGWPIGGHFSRT